uniref:Uncharacterized protein n=1 Tax=Anguilla anguilla TaxID=7936 RepID=A0A0E9SVB7_ANGAN
MVGCSILSERGQFGIRFCFSPALRHQILFIKVLIEDHD